MSGSPCSPTPAASSEPTTDIASPTADPKTSDNHNTTGANATGVVTSSLTVLMTACDSEYLFWLLNNASMKYELESYTDYQSAPNQPDSKCPTVSSASGVGPSNNGAGPALFLPSR